MGQQQGATQGRPTDFIPPHYALISEENGIKHMEDTQTGECYVLKENMYSKKSAYDSAFRRMSQRESPGQHCQELVRMWSQEHNNICSNVYKVYALYQQPRVTLLEEIRARKEEGKYFQQHQLLTIVQSCLTAVTDRSEYHSLSPALIYITSEGVLKVTHPDLLDPNADTTYNPLYYYSPQKMTHFDDFSTRTKDIVFSIGLTVLHAGTLVSPAGCYDTAKRQFNHNKMAILESKIREIYPPNTAGLVEAMLSQQDSRPHLDEVLQVVNQQLAGALVTSFNGDTSSLQLVSQLKPRDLQPETSFQKEEPSFNSQRISFVPTIRKSQFEIVFDHNRESLKHRPTCSGTAPAKENIFTDPTIMRMIKSGVEGVKESSRQQLTEKKVLRENGATERGIFLKTKNDSCTFVVEQEQEGSRYEGMSYKGLKHGFGKLIYPDGVYYEGNFEDDNLSGEGCLFYGPNRPAYIGHWTNNAFNGKGTLYNEHPQLSQVPFDYRNFNQVQDQWVKFEGNFVNDLKQGQGKIILSNGETMEGNFQEGILNGPGTFHCQNGQLVRGEWRNNLLVQTYQ